MAITNADRIRSLSDEELAIWINEMFLYPDNFRYNESQKIKQSAHWLKWLQQEAKEANDES